MILLLLRLKKLLTVYNTPKLVFSFKKLILGAAGFYVAAGLSIYIAIDVINHPEEALLSMMGLISNSIFFSSQAFVIGAWVLVTFLSMLMLPSLPLLVARKLKLSHMPYELSGERGNIMDLISGQGESARHIVHDEAQASEKSGVISGNKGMIMVADGKIMFVNKEFCLQTGYSPAQVIGRDFVEFILPKDLPKYAMLIRKSSTESHFILGIGIKTLNQRELEVYIAGNKNSSANPNDICLFHLQEVSAVEKSISTVNDWFIQSMEAIDSRIFMWDDNGMLYMSSNCQDLIPASMGLLMKKPGFLLKTVKGDDREKLRSALEKYNRTLSFSEEVKIDNGNGEPRWFKVQLKPYRDQNGNITHHIGIANEITETKLKLDEMEVTCEDARNANFNKTAFLANMSHEIRSPLNGILGFSELLTDPDITMIDRERYIDIIKNNGNALLTILTDIIDISKLESGKMKIVEREFLPAELMRELQLQFANDPLVTHKGLSLKWLISDDIAGARLISDPFRIRQILVNLITNALKYSNKGKIEIAAERWDDRAVFWIKDTGIGIPDDSLPYIFDRFRQVAKTDSSNVTGFGLGLAICKALVELMGGNIWAESRAGQGSVFYFTIPYTTPKLTEMNNVNSNETAFPYDWKGRTILIAEDIDFSFLYIEAVLRRTGARVLWAQNGREAIEMVKVNPGIDIALMDIHMPIMNGYDATREIVKLRPDLPVIAQTAFVLPDDVKACYAAGCAGYLAKPIRREQLLNTLTDYFEKIDQNASLQAGNMPVYRSKIS